MSDLVVYIWKNHIEVVSLEDSKAAAGSAPFTSTRLLVGNYPEAKSLLRTLVKEVRSTGLFAVRPRMVIQPLEMTEGGLSWVEGKVLIELGADAGARDVKVHVGEKLSTQAAADLLDSRA